MQTNTLFSHGWRGALCLALIVLLSALGAPTAAPGASAEMVAADIAPPLLQFTAGGHVIGFAPTQVILAAFDHALRVEFVGTAGVTPVAAGAEAAASDDGPTMGHAQPLGTVTYPDLWRGISVEYRASENGIVKSTYTVAPGADAAQIRLRYNVAAQVQSDGSLQFSFGRGVISESTPIAWQEIDGVRVPIAVAFELVSDADADASLVTHHASLVTFHVGAYDPRYPLTIDPNYAWHTFYGSSEGDASYNMGDMGYGIAVDGSGNVYITGESYATWQGPNGESPKHSHSGFRDIVVVKLNSAGAYLWHTFYGSSASDLGYDIAVDGSGNVYIAGFNWGTWQGDNNTPPLHPYSGWGDIVVVKLTSAGAYQWHTFYGSSDLDRGNGIAVDGSGNVYITGWSDSTWQGDGGTDPLHAHSSGTNDDIVVLKLTTEGGYQWHTFYGSTSQDFGYGIAVDGSGNVYITGYSRDTWQGDGGANPIHPYSGWGDIVALKLTSAGAYGWHTFYGSAEDDAGRGIAVDGSGNVYITGESEVTWQGDGNTPPLHPYHSSDIVVVKLTSAGVYQWHTFYGQSYADIGYGIAVDGSGNVYITGYSYDTWQGDGNTPPLHAHSGDLVALKLTSAGAYRWHTFYGPSERGARGYDIAVDGDNVYIAGESWGPWQGDNNANPLHAYSGGIDIAVLKLLGTSTKLYLPLILKGH